MISRGAILIGLLLFCTSCGSYMLDNAQSDLRDSFATGDYEHTAELINSFEKEEIYKPKDEVLLNLEQGTVNHFAGNYQQSSKYFTSAENKMDELFTKSINRGIRSFMVNDNLLEYDGEDYEDVYLNVFKSLNYLHQQDLESALVEARRISYKLGQLNVKYNGLVESLSKADSTNIADDKWKTGTSNIQQSALGHYLSAVLFAKTNKPDDARIEFQHLRNAYREQNSVFSYEPSKEVQFSNITQPETYNVLVQVFSGRAPVKNQNDFRIFLGELNTYMKFSLPSLKIHPSRVASVEVVINDAEVLPVPLIEQMDRVATEVYKVKEPIIYARAFVRTFSKAIASGTASKAVSRQNENLGLIMSIFGLIAQETTEKADLRSWQTMPGKAYANVLNLPEGEHEITINYYSKTGALLYSDKQLLNIRENVPLSLVESMYWN